MDKKRGIEMKYSPDNSIYNAYETAKDIIRYFHVEHPKSKKKFIIEISYKIKEVTNPEAVEKYNETILNNLPKYVRCID